MNLNENIFSQSSNFKLFSINDLRYFLIKFWASQFIIFQKNCKINLICFPLNIIEKKTLLKFNFILCNKTTKVQIHNIIRGGWINGTLYKV